LPYPGVVDKYCTKIGGKKIGISVSHQLLLSSVISQFSKTQFVMRMCHIFCIARCGILITAVISLDLEMLGAAILELELLVSFVLQDFVPFLERRLMNNKRLKRD
jgi:hypothetical protein